LFYFVEYAIMDKKKTAVPTGKTWVLRKEWSEKMSDTTEKFRGRLFGGFDRRDVVDYISRLADERNQAIVERDQLFERVAQLEEELAALTGEPDDVPETEEPEIDASETEEPLPETQKEEHAAAPDDAPDRIPEEAMRAVFTEMFQNMKGNAVKETDEIVGDLEERYASLKTDMEVTAAHMRCELKKMSDYLSSVTEAFSNTEKKIGELRQSVSDGLPAEEKNRR